jgi:hypothetical protein
MTTGDHTVPYPSTLQAVWEYRHQGLLAEAARERLAILASRPPGRQERSVFGEAHDSIIQRGIDEALACQDMLERVPVAPSRVTRLVAFIVDLRQALVRHLPGARRRVATTEPHGNFIR